MGIILVFSQTKQSEEEEENGEEDYDEGDIKEADEKEESLLISKKSKQKAKRGKASDKKNN